MAANSRALLESKKLLGTEGLVVDLRSGFNQILEVGARQEVAKVDEFAVVLILDCETLVEILIVEKIHGLTIDDAPLVLAATDVPAIDNNSPLRADNGERHELLLRVRI